MSIKLILSTSIAILSISTLKAQTPNWADNIACIMYSHCTSCHNPNGAAPISFLNYTDVVANKNAIKYDLNNNIMPPWPVDNNYRKMAHDRSISENEKATILAWINNSTPQGNMANAPAQPTYNSSEVITTPNLKLKIPTYTVPSITEDLYRCFVLPTGLSLQKYITAIEILPGNKSIVHHVQVFYDTTGICTNLDNIDPNIGYTSAGGVGTDNAVLLGTWVPGSSPIFVPNGMGKKLPQTAKIVLQIHYPEYASGQVDSTKVNFLFTSTLVRDIYDADVLNHSTSMIDGPLFIPKNTVKTFHQKYVVPINATVLNIGPHAHLLCKSMKSYAVTIANDTIPLINIPEWDFHWQGSYDFQKPIKLPIGCTLYGEATYDNTINNPENPFNPPQDISLGEATTNEMMLFYFSYAAYKAGDENIIIDTFNHKPHHDNCISNYTRLNTISNNLNLIIFPNPANQSIAFNLISNNDFSVSLYNHLGQEMMSQKNTKTINTSEFISGMYLIKIKQGDLIHTQKIIIEH